MNEHYLVITEFIDGVPEWDIEHPEDCPTVEYYKGVLDYGCQVGHDIRMNGLEAFGPLDEWLDFLPSDPGKYLIEAWSRKRLNYNCALEYESGLDFKDLPS